MLFLCDYNLTSFIHSFDSGFLIEFSKAVEDENYPIYWLSEK